MPENTSEQYLKFLKRDILIHSILLFLGTVPTGILFVIGNYFSSKVLRDCGTVGCVSDSRNMFFLALVILFVTGVLGLVWQLISLFISKKHKAFYSKQTRLCRKIVSIYYYLLIFSLIGYLIFIGIWSYYPAFSPFSSFFGWSLIVLFLSSPICWLAYYVFLFKQKKFLLN